MNDTNDKATKNFEAYPDVAADIINALMYHGEYQVKQEHLVSAPTESIYQGRDALHNQLEDVGKYELLDGQINALYLFANQTKADPGMILRKAGYIGAAYREQYDGKVKEICPVMELVLYWGKRKWTGKQTLYQLLQHKKLSRNAWEFIDDMKLHVFEMRDLQPEVRQRFTSDMRIVLDYLAEGDGYCSNRRVVHKAALIKMIRILAGEKNVEDTETILEEMNIREEDEITVCELFDQYTRKGIKEGIKEGIKALIMTCRELGVSFDETAEKLRLRFSLADEEIQESMKQYW